MSSLNSSICSTNSEPQRVHDSGIRVRSYEDGIRVISPEEDERVCPLKSKNLKQPFKFKFSDPKKVFEKEFEDECLKSSKTDAFTTPKKSNLKDDHIRLKAFDGIRISPLDNESAPATSPKSTMAYDDGIRVGSASTEAFSNFEKTPRASNKSKSSFVDDGIRVGPAPVEAVESFDMTPRVCNKSKASLQNDGIRVGPAPMEAVNNSEKTPRASNKSKAFKFQFSDPHSIFKKEFEEENDKYFDNLDNDQFGDGIRVRTFPSENKGNVFDDGIRVHTSPSTKNTKVGKTIFDDGIRVRSSSIEQN